MHTINDEALAQKQPSNNFVADEKKGPAAMEDKKMVTFSFEEVVEDTSSSSSSSSSASSKISEPSSQEESFHESSSNNEPASLEGVLHVRKGKSGFSGSFWKRRYVVLNLLDGGICCYKHTKELHIKNAGSAYKTRKRPSSSVTRLHRRTSLFGEEGNANVIIGGKQDDGRGRSGDKLAISLPASLSWTVKDIANDPSCFVIEIDTSPDASSSKQRNEGKLKGGEVPTVASDDESINKSSDDNSFQAFSGSGDDIDCSYLDDREDSEAGDENTDDGASQHASLVKEMEKAKRNGKELMRLYFRCMKGGNEKVLWLKAFSRMGRLSSGFRRKKFLLGTLGSKTKDRLTTSRKRSASSAAFLRESFHFDDKTTNTTPSSPRVSINLNFAARVRNREKEHRVLPEYAYPNVWMTQAEMTEEMEKPSETFHDLRQNACRLDLPNNPCNQPEVGTFQIECLQGLGFPKLDRYSQTDAVVYIVSGPYAFCTDVIKNRGSPMWLAKSQRACTIPLHHSYARVYIGVFDDEKSEKDDFNGRIVIEIARLRPNSTYDVTLPLRLSSHVYSRRRRGSLRIRFRLQWNSTRSALFSYLDVPQLRNFNPNTAMPNTDTIVACGSARAFRNVAITVHGAHLPQKFSFQLLRATLREINFTRKKIMTIFRTTIRELRDWDNPLMSCYVFCAWMHCVYHNAVSLVPAYTVLYFLLILFRNYARYGMDGPNQRGFIPPSWEELLMGLLTNPTTDSAPIEPLDMGYQTEMIDEKPVITYNFQTHKPKGKTLFRTLGFIPEEATDDNDANHLEFPFADGKLYPKFGVQDSLVVKKKNKKKKTRSGRGSTAGRRSESQASHGHFIEMPEILRKDASGLWDYDDEEERFNTGKFLRQTGATSLKGAASGLYDVGEGLTEVTGLQYVVSPIKDGLQHYVVPPIRTGIKTGISGINHVAIQPLQHTVESIRRSSTELWPSQTNDTAESQFHYESEEGEQSDGEAYASLEDLDALDQSETIMFSEWGGDDHVLTQADSSLTEPIPDQDIDYGGNSSKNRNRKRLTDDLIEVKEKFHELTFHKFNDRAYVVKDSNSRYFAKNQSPFKRRKVEVSRNLDKLLQIGPYSHSNPVVARVGQYVEPIVGASHSFLCAFRALFNVMSWRDPYLTFWVSLFGVALVVLLFVFPWRLFLFVSGIWFVGPHLFVIRILRKRGIVPPKKTKSKPNSDQEDMFVPDDQVIFKGHISQDQKRKPQKPVDPQEVHYVVVPYNQMMYQRFYDWPPEQDYAQVRSDKYFQVSASSSKATFGGSRPKAPTNSNDGVAFLPTDNSFFSSTIVPSEKKDQ